MRKPSLLRKYEYLIFLIFILIAVLSGILSLSRIKKDSLRTVRTTLTTINTSCSEALKQWMNFRRTNIQELSENQYLINTTVALLKVKQDSAVLVSSTLTKELRTFFQPILRAHEDLGVFLIAPNYVSIFSMRDSNTGSINLMAKQNKELLDKVFHGEIVLFPPMQSDVVLKTKYSNQVRQTMFLVAPIIYRDKVIAAFSLRLDIQKDFSRILGLGKIGKTGETFGFDKSGKLVTVSRFESELQKKKLLGPSVSSITNVYATGLNEIAKKLHSMIGANHDLTETKDYRGKEVLCVSRWIEAMNIGVVTKIDRKEAMEDYLYVRKIMLITLLSLLISGFIIISIIVRLRQKTENILTKSKESLEMKVAQRTEELQETIKTKDKFFSIIAHDLRSPFTGLLGLFDFLLQDPEAIPDDEKNRVIRQIYNSSTQLFRLLENLLNWSRAQTNDIKLHPVVISVDELINENLSLQKEQAKNKNIKLENVSPKQVRVYADRNTTDTVIRNLISNAIKFTEEGGEIKVKATVDDHMVEISVQDNGVGMSAETLGKLFRIDEKITTKGTNNEKGTGLGLALCKEFVELNKGSISVESKVGKGSVFKIKLPASEK